MIIGQITKQQIDKLFKAIKKEYPAFRLAYHGRGQWYFEVKSTAKDYAFKSNKDIFDFLSYSMEVGLENVEKELK